MIPIKFEFHLSFWCKNSGNRCTCMLYNLISGSCDLFTTQVLEKTEAELLALLTEYEQLQEIMERYTLPTNLPMAKDALQLHNEHSQLIKESRLAQLCQRCQEIITRLRQPALHPHAFSPSKHPDIRDCMSRLEAHMSSLYSTCGLLTTLWKQKNFQLKECLQLRQLEYEYQSVSPFINNHL